ncbi:MAG: hypothetical protein IT193_06030 [Propionibacteriaceae bacterium]|nr:hypothetical protein [Propionibacteriaceae bacterium]
MQALNAGELTQALNAGELTQAQLRQLITIEAQAMGLPFDAAVCQARARTLPRTALGSDIEMLVELLAA